MSSFDRRRIASDILFAGVVASFSILMYWLIWGEIFPTDSVKDSILERVVPKRAYPFAIGATLGLVWSLLAMRWGWAIFFAITGMLWVALVPSITIFLQSLGADSFLEAKSFDLDEAIFWLSTLKDIIDPKIDIYILTGVILTLITCFILRSQQRDEWKDRKHLEKGTLTISLLICLASVFHAFGSTVKQFIDNSSSFLNISKNFDKKIPEFTKDERSLNLYVYIGESTSTMNMGIYGYFRNTTPSLTNAMISDPGFLLIHNVLSTHTHTSQSLLEALSLPVSREDDYLPINEKRRISAIDILVKAGIQTELFSNQGMTGTWQHASSIIFKNANRNFSVDSRRMGDLNYKLTRPRDDQFFSESLNSLTPIDPKKSRAIFLHSRSGHGDYLEEIPEEFHGQVDDFYSRNSNIRISKNDQDMRMNVESYDSAIKYVDYSVSKVLERVSQASEPSVFIYFSDHGESVFTGRAHDSSRFVHEMLRVPFIMYFNEAARTTHSDLFRKYLKLAENRQLATLAQLSSTLLDVLGVTIKKGQYSTFEIPSVIGESWNHPPIFVRELKDTISYMDINGKKSIPPKEGNKSLVDITDDDTKIFIQFASKSIIDIVGCQNQTDSWEVIRRAQLTRGCPPYSVIEIPQPSKN